MYTFLLAFGALIAAIGLVCVASGVSPLQHAFDPTLVTPGMIALVGGLVVVALGLAVRTLQHIERVLAAQVLPRSIRPSEAAAAAAAMAAEQASQTARNLAPPQPEAQAVSQTPTLVVPTQAGAIQYAPPDRGRELAPTLVRAGSTVVAEVAVVPPPQAMPARSNPEVGEIHNGVAAAALNGAAAKGAQRPGANGRAVPAKSRQVKSSLFETFWPKTQRPQRNGHSNFVPPAAVPAPPAAAPPPAVEPVQAGEPAPAPYATVVMPEAPMPISILKAGVVDGMAYTLYSDGSIEAQLPQGLLRFGSITELRNHIEQAS